MTPYDKKLIKQFSFQDYKQYLSFDFYDYLMAFNAFGSIVFMLHLFIVTGVENAYDNSALSVIIPTLASLAMIGYFVLVMKYKRNKALKQTLIDYNQYVEVKVSGMISDHKFMKTEKEKVLL